MAPHVCVRVCEQVEVVTKGCVFGTNGDVRAAPFCLPPSLSVSLSLLCVTSKSEACWLDLHLIQLVSSISATLKNSRLFSRLHRHLIPGNTIPRTVDMHVHPHTHMYVYTRTHKHLIPGAHGVMIKRGREREWARTSTALAKQKNTRGGEKGGWRKEPGTKLMAHNSVGIVTKWICRPIVCNKRPNWSRASCPLSVALFGMSSML